MIYIFFRGAVDFAATAGVQDYFSPLSRLRPREEIPYSTAMPIRVMPLTVNKVVPDPPDSGSS